MKPLLIIDNYFPNSVSFLISALIKSPTLKWENPLFFINNSQFVPFPLAGGPVIWTTKGF